MQRTSTTRSVSRGSFGELNENLLGDETLVAYAAAAGTTAADGTGRNSPYTTALLAYLEQPLEIGILFREVRAQVLGATAGQQRPHEYASLLNEHYLGGVSESGAGTAADNASAGVLAQQETVFWQSISGSQNPTDFQAYLEQFPNGVFARLARNRVAAFSAPPGDPPTTDRPDSDQPRVLEPGTVFRDCDDCPDLVVVPAGTFQMGLAEVQVSTFGLGLYEVTRAQFAEFAAATGHSTSGCIIWRAPDGWVNRSGASWRDPGFGQSDSHPVVCVNWEDASAYVQWLSGKTGEQYRLPTEAEWEYAARAGTTTTWPWGERQDDLCAHGNSFDITGDEVFGNWRRVDCRDGAVWTAPVGSFAPNVFGLYDMLGNVWEWTSDCWEEGDCGRRVLRGGSWVNVAEYLRPGARGRYTTANRIVYNGFRVSRTLD